MLLLLLLLTPLIGIFLISTTVENSNTSLSLNRIKFIGLSSSIVNLFISLVIFILFNFSLNEFQFVQEHHAISSFDFYLGVDGISIYFVLLTTIIMPIAILSNWSSISENVKSYIVIMLLLETLLLAVFLVLDILLFYIFFESILPPLFILIGLFGSSNRVRASFYLFLYTLLGSLFLLLSILTMSSIMGSTDFDALYKTNFNFYTQLFLFIGIFIAFAVKTPTIFLNTWLLKAHVESPLGGSIVLAAIVLKLSLYGILRLILPLLPKAQYYSTSVVYVIGVITIIYASLSTLRTIDVKELIAYSSVSHAAVYLLGVFSNTIQGIEGGIVLGLAHGFVSSGLFICAGGILYDRSSTRLITYYRGIAQLMPLFSILFFILCLGNAGTPLTLNFVGEFMCLYGAFEQHALLGALASSSIIFSAAYTIYMFNRITFGGSYSKFFTVNIPDVNKREFIILLTLVIFTVVFGIYPSVVLDGLHYSVSCLIYSSPDTQTALLLFPLLSIKNNKNSKKKWKNTNWIYVVGIVCLIIVCVLFILKNPTVVNHCVSLIIANVRYIGELIYSGLTVYLFSSFTISFIFTLAIVCFYLEDWKLSDNRFVICLQIISCLCILLYILHLCFITNFLSFSDCMNINENKSGSSGNNISLGANIELSEGAAKEISKGIGQVGSNIGLGATTAGVSAAVGKAIAKSAMPPLQKASVVLGSGIIGAGIHVAASAVNRKNNINNNIHNTPNSNTGLNKFLGDNFVDNSALFDLTLGIKLINYGCLLLVFILFIQILFKFFLSQDKIKLNLSNIIGASLNNKLNYYFIKIVNLNKKMSNFYIWFIILVLIIGLSFSTYFITELHDNLDLYVNSHSDYKSLFFLSCYVKRKDLKEKGIIKKTFFINSRISAYTCSYPTLHKLVFNNIYVHARLMSSSLHDIPMVKKYDNSKHDHKSIVNDFKAKSVIYMWHNKVKDEVYVGSTIDGQQRLRKYYYISHLINQKNSRICSSLLKYGHSNFSFYILHVCGEKGTIPSNILLEKERFYLKWALKIYGLKVLNIRPVMGQGETFRLSNEAVYKLVGKKHTSNTRAIIRSSKLNDNNPNYSKINVISTRVGVVLEDNSTRNIVKYDSLSNACKTLKTTSKTLKSYIEDVTLFRGKYTVKLENPRPIGLKLKILDLDTSTLQFYGSIRKAAASLNTSSSNISRYISRDSGVETKVLKSRYIITLV